jgi:hypothetical protein
VFQEAFLRALQRLHHQGKLVVPPGLDLERCLQQAAAKPWEVYLQPPTAGPERLLRYLGRYTQRVALSPSRILGADQTHVTFAYKDYRQGGRTRELRLEGAEFLGRFLQHVLPKGFRRIRHYGLWHSSRRSDLEALRQQWPEALIRMLAALPPAGPAEALPAARPCPYCGGVLSVVLHLDPNYQDSS